MQLVFVCFQPRTRWLIVCGMLCGKRNKSVASSCKTPCLPRSNCLPPTSSCQFLLELCSVVRGLLQHVDEASIIKVHCNRHNRQTIKLLRNTCKEENRHYKHLPATGMQVKQQIMTTPTLLQLPTTDIQVVKSVSTCQKTACATACSCQVSVLCQGY